MALDDLRWYRQELITEEARVSYWRRILHVRLDTAHGDTAPMGRMRAVINRHQSDSRRLALVPLADNHQHPPLPDLAVLWETTGGSDGGDGTGSDGSDLLARMSAAEQELSTYRQALHERLDSATGELIMRYRDEPNLALRALPSRAEIVS